MQLSSVYLLSNKIDVFTNALASWQNERYRRVYNRNLKIYRSVDNRIDIQVRNSDQKAQNVTGSTLVFNLISREDKNLILSKDCITVDAVKGRVYVNLTKAELEDIEKGFYAYSVVSETRTSVNTDSTTDEYTVSNRKALYIDSQYGVVSPIEVSGDVLGDTTQTLTVNKFEYVNPATLGESDPDYYISSIIDTKGENEVPQSLHTFQFNFNNYIGQVTIQASLNEGGVPHEWVDVQSSDVTPGSNTFSVSLETTLYKNVVGKWNFFRIKHIPNNSNTGTLDTILYR
jgi:hypothetical protein